MKLTIACCDDELTVLKKLKKQLETAMIQTDMELEIDYFVSGEILLERYEDKETVYDVLILDMEMPDMTGIELADTIRKKYDQNVIIIFLTSYPQYMHQSFQVQAFDYLMKPIQNSILQETLFRAYRYIKREQHNLLFVNTGNEEIVLRTSEIYYIEKEKGAALMGVFSQKGKMIVKGNLNDIEEKLEKEFFIKVNRGCMVNMRFVYKFFEKSLELTNGTVLEMSRRKVTEVKERVTRFTVLGE